MWRGNEVCIVEGNATERRRKGGGKAAGFSERGITYLGEVIVMGGGVDTIMDLVGYFFIKVIKEIWWDVLEIIFG